MSGICVECRQMSVNDVSFGFTDTAMKVLNFFQGTNATYTQSVTAPSRKRENIVSELFEIYERCSDGNWDGEGALAISSDTMFEALNFIRLLPADVRLPDVSPSTEGAIDFEWRKDRARCNIELSGSGEIVYSVYFSKYNRDFGIKPYVEKIPNNVIDIIESMS